MGERKRKGCGGREKEWKTARSRGSREETKVGKMG